MPEADALSLVAESSARLWAPEGREALAYLTGPHAIRRGRPLVIVEGDFDALVLGQDLGELAAVVTLGSASGRPDPGIFASMLAVPRWFLATDADDAGDKAAGRWPARSRRVRPPAPFKDWTEARQGGVDLARWWSARLGGNEAPPLFAWDDLAGRRWGPAVEDHEPGILIDRPDQDRRLLALATLNDPEERVEIQAEAE